MELQFLETALFLFLIAVFNFTKTLFWSYTMCIYWNFGVEHFQGLGELQRRGFGLRLVVQAF
jgi:hypothetical protein